MINDTDIQRFSSEFPKLELSYEHITHKKVHDADIMIVIPEGKQYFAWFTTYKEQNVCFLLEIDKNNMNNIIKTTICKTGFDDKLSYGTILYGTLFYSFDKLTRKNTQCFSIEDIYQYKGKDCSRSNYMSKLQIFKTIFELSELSQFVIFDSYTVFGLPLMYNCDKMNEINVETIKHTVCYKISSFKYRYINNRKIFKQPNPHLKHIESSKMAEPPMKTTEPPMKILEPSMKILEPSMKILEPPKLSQINSRNMVNSNNHINRTQGKVYKIFTVKPDIQNDIYSLCSPLGNFIEYACIPDYKTSIMMNKLFRNIKENTCLDYLEESDDETEFENSNIDKFVYLDKTYKMNCEYNYKFKKWIPVSVV